MSLSVSTTTLTSQLSQLSFLLPQTTPKYRLLVSKFQSRGWVSSGYRVPMKAVRENQVVVVKDGDREEFGYNGPNGSANGAVNGSLLKYVNGNGPAIDVVGEVEDGVKSENGRKRTVEEIGQEDAWFKSGGPDNVQVSVTPGGRWNRFKTYSTIQRTLEIWGSVLTFLFKVWFNNQKFAYRGNISRFFLQQLFAKLRRSEYPKRDGVYYAGGMTEEKRVIKRKALAKWLKESILRLGPTFIKIGQQFSTRVDILAQEYVDQLAELQMRKHRFEAKKLLSLQWKRPASQKESRAEAAMKGMHRTGHGHCWDLTWEEHRLRLQTPGHRFSYPFEHLGRQCNESSFLLRYRQIPRGQRPLVEKDQVPPFPSETAVSIIVEELGAPLGDIFDRFDYEPIAAASLGQVHRARLKGQEVVVKVQRPGLKDLFDIDLKNLRVYPIIYLIAKIKDYVVASFMESWTGMLLYGTTVKVIAEYLQKIDPKSDGAKRDWVAIYDECANVLYQEIDYTQEASNAELFANNFKDMDYVKVPRIYFEYTTPQVLTMEYVPGIKINRIKALDQLGVDRQRLGRYAVESYLEQILSHGFFHADPHPGNIAVDDVNGGRLIFYDFGMMGSISPNIREGLLEVFYGVYEKDPDKVLQSMIQMGVLVPTGDMTAVRRTAQFFLTSFEERLVAQRKEREVATTELGFKKPLSKEEKMQKKKQRLAAIGEDLLSIAGDQPFRFPATFTFVVRAFSVLDGIGKGLDPRFDITEIAKPYALELLRFREAGVEDFRKRWDRQSRAFYNLFRQADRVEKLAGIIQRLEQGDLKLRVRALESERAFQRVAVVQKTVGSAVAAGSLINLATILYLNSIRVPATAAYVVCAFFGIQVLFGILKVKKLDLQEKLITGTA
ncbi:hypothetical protein GIB67_026163 [Kingdonia uniflora]|uniref:ABC1 atypical kinase-like domain-containing protein n=1 Tax=Kingdonia uniflora TaxID=39325 RepID=A0A7J7M385_9MAGN|nr:hypothetical protein GIB67_026163 [Kingdonia uniflora]